ncbi:phosphoribosyltransferase [Rhodococcus sp. Eu-32]|uniref:phosphoribosyltransferase n=1 Tax=Rhodococcus sp. Eu-32 TaxID=1017319 RepID=UPI000DF2F2B5|nr:phosphoribosyltransferase family protein [Rhodococcus sp. Eu-32]RRQ29901.1 phosphoribosyltransferase [Rhodococcus sp. Eu-32]
MMFADRMEAGRILAKDLGHLAGQNPLVLALPRGGVPVAAEIASALGAKLDVIAVRKLGVPGQPELAMGAIGENGTLILNRDVIDHLRITADDIDHVRRQEEIELARRAQRWRRHGPRSRRGRLAVIVDDGMATGATAEAACRVAAAEGAAGIVLAVPVASPDAVARIQPLVNEVRCRVDSHLDGVGAAYGDFHQLTDDEVTALLL